MSALVFYLAEVEESLDAMSQLLDATDWPRGTKSLMQRAKRNVRNALRELEEH